MTINICVHYETENINKDMRVHIGLSVSTQLGTVVFSITSRLIGIEFKDIPQSGTFTCQIPKLPLPPSIYNLGIQIKVDAKISDWIDDTFQMTVIEGNFFGSGKTSSQASGICLVDGNWKLSPRK